MDDELNNRGSWEKAWEKALDEPSVTPPSRVWQGLENSLMEQQLGRYKRRMARYQAVAAASVILLGLWTGWWILVAEPGLQPASAPLATTATPAATGTLEQPATPLMAASDPTQLETARRNRPNRSSFFAAPPFYAGYTPFSVNPSSVLGLNRSVTAFGRVGLRAFYGGPKATADNAYAAGDLPLDPALLSAIEAELELQQAQLQARIEPVAAGVPATTKKTKKAPLWQSNGKIWLGASLASTRFSPNISEDERGMSYLMSQQAPGKGGQVYSANMKSWNEKENSMPSLDFRLEAAYRFRPRWMLQTSLHYARYRVNTLAGTFFDQADKQSYPLYYSNFSYDKLQLTNPNSRMAQPIEAINTYSFVRVPIALNYVIFERSVGVALSSGLSADVFLGSKIADQESLVQEFEIGAGTESPFNRLHVSGQLGLQLYYRAGHNYLFTLEPSYRHALSSFSKSESYFNSKPSQIGIAAGFRFILR